MDPTDDLLTCSEHPLWFIDHHVSIYDATAREWIPFRLWPEQVDVLDRMHEHHLTIVLKARQLGLTWLVLGYALWLMIFQPKATVLLFSKREEEAVYLLSDERLRGMYSRLPAYLKPQAAARSSAAEKWALANGSVARAFPSNAGDSYTASLAIVDEADLVPDLDRLLRSAKPTIDGGGKMVLVSRADKSKPESEFKRIYLQAKEGRAPWRPIFLPWHVHPQRDQQWYQAQAAHALALTGSLDDLHEQYPATDTEALAPRTLDKRIAPEWLQQCYAGRQPYVLGPEHGKPPAIPGLVVYRLPVPGKRYVLGADVAEGNPSSDESALVVLEQGSAEEVATLAGRFQPSTFAAHIDAVGQWCNRAAVLVERNNHGHAVLGWLRDHSRLPRLRGHDGREGWLSTTKSKALLYNTVADFFRDRKTILHSFATFVQLASIEGSTFRAPEGQRDDRADAYALACVAIMKCPVHQRPPWAYASGGCKNLPRNY